jgi:tripartite-type tricarboxylate transporter receptor subunit TctC
VRRSHVAALPAVSRIARAQTYPSRPVRIIVGYAPGNGADTLARMIGQSLSERLHQPFVIENRPGGHRMDNRMIRDLWRIAGGGA